MIQFVEFLSNFYNQFIGMFNQHRIDVGGISVSPIEILIGFLILSIITTIVWKGAKG